MMNEFLMNNGAVIAAIILIVTTAATVFIIRYCWADSFLRPNLIMLCLFTGFLYFIAPIHISTEMLSDVNVKKIGEQYIVSFASTTINSQDDIINVKYVESDSGKYILKVDKMNNIFNCNIATDYTLLLPTKATVLQESDMENENVGSAGSSSLIKTE